MRKRAEFLMCQGNSNAGEGFLLLYKRSILPALQKEGLLDREELDSCLLLLDNNNCKAKTPDSQPLLIKEEK